MQNPTRPDIDENAPAQGSEAMMANLRKDVSDWNKVRHANEGTSSIATAAAPPARTRPARAPKAPETPPPAAPTADGKKQPFRMSYDGISAAEHAAARHLLGAR